MGEQITDKGIGNGVSLIIFVGIVSNFPSTIGNYAELIRAGEMNPWTLAFIIIGMLIVIVGVTFIDLGQRRLPVQYAKRQVGRKVYGGQSTYIPLRINNAGVLPLIFAMALVSFPQLIMQAFFPNSSALIWYTQYLGTNSFIYPFIYALLILFFSYFANSMSFNPTEIADNIREYGGFITGIRPGYHTAEYIGRINNRLTLFGAIFLMIVAAIPTFFTRATGITSAFGTTSILIMVSVALETSKQIEAQMVARNYRGFLK
jgi:preprotein translocase subunit SecY